MKARMTLAIGACPIRDRLCRLDPNDTISCFGGTSQENIVIQLMLSKITMLL